MAYAPPVRTTGTSPAFVTNSVITTGPPGNGRVPGCASTDARMPARGGGGTGGGVFVLDVVGGDVVVLDVVGGDVVVLDVVGGDVVVLDVGGGDVVALDVVGGDAVVLAVAGRDAAVPAASDM